MRKISHVRPCVKVWRRKGLRVKDRKTMRRSTWTRTKIQLPRVVQLQHKFLCGNDSPSSSFGGPACSVSACSGARGQPKVAAAAAVTLRNGQAPHRSFPFYSH